MTDAHTLSATVGTMVELKPAGTDDARARNPYTKYRKLLTPQRVRELSTLKPWRTMLDTAWCWLGIVAGWALAAWALREGGWAAWCGVALAIGIVGTRYYALFIIGHDGMHRRIFNSGPASELFTDLLLIGPIGAVCHINSRNHMDHHQHLATDDDPDLHKHACFNKASRWEYLAFLTGVASFIAVVKNVFIMPLFGRASKPEAGRDEAGRSKAAYTLRDVAIIGGWQLLLVGGLTALVGVVRGGTSVLDVVKLGWFAFPLLWLVPVYVFMYLPNLIRSFVEHSHPEDDDKADEHRLITFVSSPPERMIFSPMNMNYHIPHHLWPSIPYYNLPTADREVRSKAGTEGLTWRGSYLAYLWRYFVALPLEECRMNRHRAGRA